MRVLLLGIEDHRYRALPPDTLDAALDVYGHIREFSRRTTMTARAAAGYRTGQ